MEKHPLPIGGRQEGHILKGINFPVSPRWVQVVSACEEGLGQDGMEVSACESPFVGKPQEHYR